MSENKLDILHRIELWIQAVSLVAVPLIIFPFSLEIFAVPKQLMIGALATLLCLIFIAKTIQQKTLRVVFSPSTLMLLLFVLLHIVGLFGREQHLLRAITHPLGVLTMLSLLVIHLSFIQYTKKNLPTIFTYAFATSGSLLAFTAILWFSELHKIMPIDSLKEQLFTPTGGLLYTALVVTLCFVITAGKLIKLVHAKTNRRETLILGIGAVVMWVGIFIIGFQLITSARPVLMPYQVGWSVALKSIESRPLLGIGISNYENAYVRAKPATVNLTPVWNIRFGTGANLFFHYLSILGLSGGITLLILVFLLIRAMITAPSHAAIGLGVVLLFMLLFPPQLVSLFLLFVLSALVPSQLKAARIDFPRIHPSFYLAFLIPIVSFLASVGMLIPLLLADMQAATAFRLANSGNQKAAFDQIHSAVRIAPFREDYLMLSSRITLAIGSAILSQPDAPEADKQQAIALVDQAINEAKHAIELAPQSSITWQNIAEMYQSLTPAFAQADTWALTSYEQAVMRDPTNPLPRSYAAAILEYQGRTEEAVQALEYAVSAKPDFIPARYALANGYAKLKKPQLALNQYTTLLQLLPPDSPEAKQVQQNIETINSPIPTPLPTNKPEELLPLSPEAAPPATESSTQTP